MGVTAARKARAIVDNVESILAIELLCAAQAREFHKDVHAGRGAQAAYDLVRKHIPPNDADRYLHADIAKARELITSGALCDTVGSTVGKPLEA